MCLKSTLSFGGYPGPHLTRDSFGLSHIPKVTSIDSAVFAGLTVITDRQTDRPTDRQTTLQSVQQ